MVTDGRFSGGTRGFMVGHVAPEAYVGGPIALVKNGDKITIDTETNTLDIHVSEEELKSRKNQWKKPEPNYNSGAHCKICNTCRFCCKWSYYICKSIKMIKLSTSFIDRNHKQYQR